MAVSPGRRYLEKISPMSVLCVQAMVFLKFFAAVLCKGGVALLLPHKCSSWHWLFIGFLIAVNIGGKAHISESKQIPVKTVKLGARLPIAERHLFC